jgi:hypothetical protein
MATQSGQTYYYRTPTTRTSSLFPGATNKPWFPFVIQPNDSVTSALQFELDRDSLHTLYWDTEIAACGAVTLATNYQGTADDRALLATELNIPADYQFRTRYFATPSTVYFKNGQSSAAYTVTNPASLTLVEPINRHLMGFRCGSRWGFNMGSQNVQTNAVFEPVWGITLHYEGTTYETDYYFDTDQTAASITAGILAIDGTATAATYTFSVTYMHLLTVASGDTWTLTDFSPATPKYTVLNKNDFKWGPSIRIYDSLFFSFEFLSPLVWVVAPGLAKSVSQETRHWYDDAQDIHAFSSYASGDFTHYPMCNFSVIQYLYRDALATPFSTIIANTMATDNLQDALAVDVFGQNISLREWQEQTYAGSPLGQVQAVSNPLALSGSISVYAYSNFAE